MLFQEEKKKIFNIDEAIYNKKSTAVMSFHIPNSQIEIFTLKFDSLFTILYNL